MSYLKNLGRACVVGMLSSYWPCLGCGRAQQLLTLLGLYISVLGYYWPCLGHRHAGLLPTMPESWHACVLYWPCLGCGCAQLLLTLPGSKACWAITDPAWVVGKLPALLIFSSYWPCRGCYSILGVYWPRLDNRGLLPGYWLPWQLGYPWPLLDLPGSTAYNWETTDLPGFIHKAQDKYALLRMLPLMPPELHPSLT